MADANAEEPLKIAPAYLMLGGVKNKAGNLLLYPDRLVHVANNPFVAALSTGALGYLLANRIGRGGAKRRAAAGGKGVTEINLFRVTRVEKRSQALNKDFLAVLADGNEHRFNVKYDKWSDDIARAIHALGRKVIGDAAGFTLE